MKSRLNCSARRTINIGRPGIPCRHFTGVEHCSITRSSATSLITFRRELKTTLWTIEADSFYYLLQHLSDC